MNTQPSTARRRWARALIERQTPNRPMYGSTEWLILPNEHVDKIAACVVAAECWAFGADNLEEDLRREIEALQMGHKQAEDEAYRRSVEAHRAAFPFYGRVLSSFEERRARQLEAAKPQPGDYKGGPVSWERGDGA